MAQNPDPMAECGMDPTAAPAASALTGSSRSVYEGRWEPRHEWLCLCPPNSQPRGGPSLRTLGTPGCIISRRAGVLRNGGLDHGSAQEQTSSVSVFPREFGDAIGSSSRRWHALLPALLLPARLFAAMCPPAPDPSFPADSGQSVSRDLLVSKHLLPSRGVGWY